jgi:hypothetical protein
MSNRILENGYRTTLSIDGVTALFEVVSITPPALQSDDPVEQTNMQTNNWRSFSGGALLSLGDISLTVHYAVGAFDQIKNILRQNKYCTIRFPDGSVLGTYCIIQSFSPEELTINEKPTASLTLKPSNRTTSNPPSEFGYVYTTGTTTTVAP